MEEDLTTVLITLQSSLEKIIERVQQNSATLLKLQAFELKLLKLDSLSDIIDHLLEEGKDYFDLDIINLCLIDESNEISRTLYPNGISFKSRPSLILLENQAQLKSTAVQPYVGIYKNKTCADFFPNDARQPASVAVTPLTRRDKYLGTLSLGSYQAERFADDMATDFIEHLSAVVSICLENILNIEEIRRGSYIDALTGVNNRRFFEQRIGEELSDCRRNTKPLSCQFFDLDYFKSINDIHGHQGGDHILTLVAAAIKNQLRDNDVFVRYGGEEFVSLMSDVDESKALDIAERIRETIQVQSFSFNELPVPVTISIGVSTYMPENNAATIDDEIAQRLIKSADSALYKAKHNGRNRVENGGVVSNKSPS